MVDGWDREVEPLGCQLPIRTRARLKGDCYNRVTKV